MDSIFTPGFSESGNESVGVSSANQHSRLLEFKHTYHEYGRRIDFIILNQN